MQRDLFSFIENLFTKQEMVTTETKFKDVFMAIKFLSLYPATFAAATEANRLSTKIPNWAVSCFLFGYIEKDRKPKFIYPKAENKSKFQEIVVKEIAAKFCCSKVHAEQIALILQKENPTLIKMIEAKRGK